MYKNILAAVNEYSNSEIAARYAIALAQSSRAKLSLVFVAEEKKDKDLFARAHAALERLFIQAQKQDIEVESVTESGDPLKKIADIIRRDSIDIVFAATRREYREKRYFVRTLSREFMVKLPCSVALVRIVRLSKGYPKNILVPLRGQLTSLDERSCFVAKLAEAFNASVTLFHLHKPITSFFHGETLLKSSEREEHVPKDIEQFTDCLHKYKISYEKKSGYGVVSRAITIEAAHKRNDLIVMGASERSILTSIIRGNPVEEVLRETPCNLIILRPGRLHS
ncbi:MAG: universal stress protein [Thermodesulfovibrionales bacterium]|nr:universal stress protein [Thermodesulfovibrionales bacterium]